MRDPLKKARAGRPFLRSLFVLSAVAGLISKNPVRVPSATAGTEQNEDFDATVIELPTEIAIDFTEPLQIRMVTVRVLDEEGADHAIGTPVIRADRRRISVRVGGLRIGNFRVQWGVIRADGSVTQGHYTFRIARDVTIS